MVKHRWGEYQKKEIFLYELTNNNGIVICISNFGCILRNLFLKDNNTFTASSSISTSTSTVEQSISKSTDIVLGYDTLEEYIQDRYYFGATIGRYANRISQAVYRIENNHYQLTANDTTHHLHGGVVGFNKIVWDTIFHSNHRIQFYHFNEHLHEGYRGNVECYITFELTLQNELKITYEATTDRPTIFNPTHHSYFNLCGHGEETIINHQLFIDADSYTPVDSTHIPLGVIHPVKNTRYDFTVIKSVGEEGVLWNGYDVNFCLHKNNSESIPSAILFEPTSNRKIEVFTDLPCLQVYTANFLSKMKGKGNKHYDKYTAICLETQHYPDAPNQKNFPLVLLGPQKKYYSRTIYKFSS